MKHRHWILSLSISSILGACVAVETPRPVVVDPYYTSPYITADSVDMYAPVYVAAYPEYTFYHRYDPSCDCILIVRMVEIGAVTYWLDHTGRRVHEGYWTPARPSHHAIDRYRSWSFDHRTEFHRTPPPRRPVVVEQSSPYYASSYINTDSVDMSRPVYVAAYPEDTFYHRYDPACDCIRIVRMVEFGGMVHWLDHTGRRVHDGHWTPVRPSHHAIDSYRSWSFDHRTEFHHTQFSRPVASPRPSHVTPPAPPPAPAKPDVKPAPPAPGPIVKPSAPQPLVGPHDRGEHEIKHWHGENGSGSLQTGKKQDDKASTQDPKQQGKDTPAKPVPDIKPTPARPAPDVKPTPAKPAPDIKPAPAPKTGEKPATKGDQEHEHNHNHHPSDKPADVQK